MTQLTSAIHIALVTLPRAATDAERTEAVVAAVEREDGWISYALVATAVWFFAMGVFLGIYAGVARV